LFSILKGEVMPAGGGDPKRLGDGKVVLVRPDFSRGGADLWDTRDVTVALMEELDRIYAATQLADFDAMKTALASGRQSIKLADMADGSQ
jgi:hypothetical protein